MSALSRVSLSVSAWRNQWSPSSVAPRDGEFATLRYFRTLGAGDAHSDARYLATSALVAELAQHGVRYLLDTATPAEQTNGLRHFQRMVGFRYARVKLRSP